MSENIGIIESIRQQWVVRFGNMDAVLEMAHGVALSPAIKDRLMRSPYRDVRAAMARRPDTSPEILAVMAKDDDRIVRKSVACNPNTPVEVLVNLSKDRDKDVREFVALNRHAPAEALDNLSKDQFYNIRKSVAFNPNTSAETLTSMSKYADRELKIRIAYHHNTPTEVLSDLARSIDVEHSDHWTKWYNDEIHDAIVRNPNTSAKTIDELSKLSKIGKYKELFIDRDEMVAKMANEKRQAAEEAASRRTAEAAAKPSIPENPESRMASAVNSGKQMEAAPAKTEAVSFEQKVKAALAKGVIKEAGELRDGWARVQSPSGKYNFANSDGKFMTNSWFDSATDFKDGKATIERNGVRADIDIKGVALSVKKIEQAESGGVKMH